MRAYLRTFGCRANHYDSERVVALLRGAGIDTTDRVADADVAIFNSCAVTSQAEAELRKAVRRAARERPALRSIVMGCASGLDAGHPSTTALRALPTVERLVAGADLGALADALGLAPGVVAPSAQRGTRALLRIQDGCDEHCTFCLTTLARGANRSRPADELVREAAALAERHPEIVLTGIHIGGYGADRGDSLGALLERLVRDVPRVRFRLSSLEATEVDGRLAELLTADPTRVAPHLHAPLQSGSDVVLRRMGRHWYTAESYARAVEGLAARTSCFGLGADVISGFPGESAADHAATVRLVDRLPFTYLHVFPYSPRPGTAATRLPEGSHPEVADERGRELRAVGERKRATHVTARAGGIADVIAVGPTEGASAGGREGITEDYLTVRLDDPTLPRGARFGARLSQREGRLWATSLGHEVGPEDPRGGSSVVSGAR